MSVRSVSSPLAGCGAANLVHFFTNSIATPVRDCNYWRPSLWETVTSGRYGSRLPYRRCHTIVLAAFSVGRADYILMQAQVQQ